jgi:hypothetical protein
LGLLRSDRLFDGAFSNFSGLNCLSELQPVARDLANHVKPGGHVLLCLWGKACVTEMLWFLARGQLRKSVRRLSTTSNARLGEFSIDITYHKLVDVRRAFAPWFEFQSHRAVGLFVPPSYAEAWVQKHTKTSARLQRLDLLFADWPALRSLGDHMLLEFVRCNP